MKVPCREADIRQFCCNYYIRQAGSGISPFSGSRYQRGRGLFSDLFRTAVPILKEGAKQVGKRLLKTGAQVIGDISSGKSLKESASERLKETGKELLQDLGRKIVQQGQGKKRKLSRKKTSGKKKRRDIFG